MQLQTLFVTVCLAVLSLRSRAVRTGVDDSDLSSEGDGACPNLVVFYDGTWNDLNATCAWPPSKQCETNIAMLWRLSSEVPGGQQKSHYEPGVATAASPNDDGSFGVGTKQHMLNGYKWLTENYQPCQNKIYVFGFSRGALSARMLQGMINRVGLAKPGKWSEAAHLNFHASSTSEIAKFKRDNAWPDVSVTFMGLFDAVLRTLLHPVKHHDIAGFHLKMTAVVSRFSHAIALSEHREIFEAGELAVDSSTSAKQVWFAGTHKDVGGGQPNTGPARIAAGWTADEAVDAGFKLPDDWRGRSEMKMSFMDDIFTEQGIGPMGSILGPVHAEKNLKLTTIRNPARCRQHANHPFNGQPILLHQSVRDRMQGNAGWAPLPWCCDEIVEDMKDNYNFVTNNHYDVQKGLHLDSELDHWFKLQFSWLSNVNKHEVTAPEYYIKVTSWHDEKPLPSGPIGDSDGCCTVLRYEPPRGSKVQWSYWSSTASQNLDGLTVLMPNEAAVATKIIVEVHEDDTLQDDFVGRIEIPMSATSAGWVEYNLSTKGTLKVKLEGIRTDDDVEAAGLPGSGPAQCRWLDMQTGLQRSTVCNPAASLGWILGRLPAAKQAVTAADCDGFIEDIKTGAL
jgi:hypothetical protein